MSENTFGLTVAADNGLDDLQCQRLLSKNRRYQEVMLQYRCALKALESRLEILNEEFSQEGCCLSEIVNFLRTACISQAKVVYYMRKEAISYGKDF